MSMAPRSWHHLEVQESLSALSSQRDGLSSADAAARTVTYGSNVIERADGPPAWVLLGRQFTSPLIYALLASAAVALLLGEVVNAVVVLAVVLLNSLIGFVQEYRAGQAIAGLATMVSAPALALRGGVLARVPAHQVVPGDVLVVSSGDRVVADLRVLTGDALRADESALTGESLPVDKSAAAVPSETVLAERSSLLHAGTLISAGHGHGLVVETGARTEIGRISGLINSADQVTTPLTRSIAALGSRITTAIAAVTLTLLVVALVRGYSVADAALAAIALAVAAIPEGLPAIVTIALAVGVTRMASRQAIVRELPAVETLGATSVICTDKTGTLTRNEMVVRRAWTPGGEFAFEGVGYSPEGRILSEGQPVLNAGSPLRDLLEAAVLANESRLSGDGADRQVLGDPTDGALLVAAERAGIDREQCEARRRVDLLPFDADLKYMASVVEAPGRPDTLTTYIKGAPEVVLDAVSAAESVAARAVTTFYADQGMRVLAFARCAGSATHRDDWPPALELLGLVGMIDPPREGVAESVAACHRAGIAVTMITGDHPGTAVAIGRDLGIVSDAPALTGPEISELDDEQLADRVRRTTVFARVAPEHKLRLVRALQCGGAIVAMTGDGVNDAPALRQADIGVAMGINGTDAAKDSADIVLGDDNFATIGLGVEEGRRVYDNLVKSIAFALPTNVGQGLVVLIAVLFFPVVGGEPILPIEPVQILWINLVATVSLALPLALESKEAGLMTRRPRDPRTPLLSRFVVVRTLYVGALMSAVAVGVFVVSLHGSGEPLSRTVAPTSGALVEAQTMAVTALMFLQIFYLLMCRTLEQPTSTIGWRTNSWVFVGIATVIVLQIGFVHLGFLNTVFGSAALSVSDWLVALMAGAVVIPIVATEKYVRRRRHRPSSP